MAPDKRSDDAAVPGGAAPTPDRRATLQVWRARGDHCLDPVRFHFIEALARRTAALDGPARRHLDERLNTLLAQYGADVARAATAGDEEADDKGDVEGDGKDGRTPDNASITPLGELLARLTPMSPPGPMPRGAPGAAGAASLTATAAGPELKSVRYFKHTWSRLRTQHRMSQALAHVPPNAGPLNSQHLVHRTLSLMRDLSPSYLERFMGHVDTLLWLDQVQAGAGAAIKARDGVRGESKGPRSRTG